MTGARALDGDFNISMTREEFTSIMCQLSLSSQNGMMRMIKNYHHYEDQLSKFKLIKADAGTGANNVKTTQQIHETQILQHLSRGIK